MHRMIRPRAKLLVLAAVVSLVTYVTLSTTARRIHEASLSPDNPPATRTVVEPKVVPTVKVIPGCTGSSRVVVGSGATTSPKPKPRPPKVTPTPTAT